MSAARFNWRFVLPAINLLVAVLLLVADRMVPKTPGITAGSIAFQLCNLINVPANLSRNLIMLPVHHVIRLLCSPSRIELCDWIEYLLRVGLFLVGVGLTWYLVGIHLEEGGPEERPSRRTYRSSRIALDIVLISIGALIALVGIGEFIQTSRYSLTNATLMLLPYSVWFLAIIFVYSRDLIRVFGTRS
jgi:hypothetical protein